MWIGRIWRSQIQDTSTYGRDFTQLHPDVNVLLMDGSTHAAGDSISIFVISVTRNGGEADARVDGHDQIFEGKACYAWPGWFVAVEVQRRRASGW